MESIFGVELPPVVKFLIAFVVVLALIVGTFWLIRRFGATRLGNSATRGRQPRLGVIDAAVVDGRRRLVLIRRDNVEHLLMIGGPSDIVVEQNIVRPAAAVAAREAIAPRPGGLAEVMARAAEPAPPRHLPGPAPASHETGRAEPSMPRGADLP